MVAPLSGPIENPVPPGDVGDPKVPTSVEFISPAADIAAFEAVMESWVFSAGVTSAIRADEVAFATKSELDAATVAEDSSRSEAEKRGDEEMK